MEKIVHSLVSLGLTEKEARMYLALYKLGKATAYAIAKESGIKRPTVYVIMESLRKRGLALVVPHAQKQLYIAKDPHEFIHECQNTVNKEGHDLLTELPKLTRPTENILVFKGDGALAQGLSYGLKGIKEKELVAFYAGIGEGTKVGREYIDHFEELYELGFTVRSVIPSGSLDADFRKRDKMYGFETKQISRSIFSPSVSIEVCGILVKTILHKKREVIVVEDKGLADLYQQMFQMFWDMA